MKQLFLLCLLTCFVGPFAQAQIFEDFEDAAVTYTLEAEPAGTAISEDLSEIPTSPDFFGRVTTADVAFSGEFQFLNVQDLRFFIANDLDGLTSLGTAGLNVSMNWDNLDVTGLATVPFSAFFGEDMDAGATPFDWDADTQVLVEVSLDGGAYSSVLAFEAEEPAGDQTNNAVRVDTDFDGIGDGTQLTETMTEFSVMINTSGASTMNVRIRMVQFNAGDEDIAIDNVSIGASPAGACMNPSLPGSLMASSSTICPSESTTLSWVGALNDATAWHVYTTSCGVDQLTTTTTNSLTVSPTVTTTYFIRGEDGAGCVNEATGACTSVTVTVLNNTSGPIFEDFEDAAVSYLLIDESTGLPINEDITEVLVEDYFGRVMLSDFDDPNYNITNIQGSSFFGVGDMDGIASLPGLSSASMNWQNLDVSGLTNVPITIFFASNIDDGATPHDWDSSDRLLVEVALDGGAFNQVFGIESIEPAGATTNTQPAVDSDFDGVGDAPLITGVLTQYAVMASTGGASSMDVRIRFVGLNASEEDIAIDNVSIGALGSAPCLMCTEPDVPGSPVASSPTICPAGSTTLSWTGALNDATAWSVYTTSCGVDLLTTTTTNSLVVSPTTTTTYFIRGEDGAGCVDETTGMCASVTVTVEDNIDPVAVCQNITVFLDGAGNATIVAADIDGGSTDNCGSVTLSASQTAFTCADQGANNVTLTVDDGNGNTDDCIAVVTVSDTISPTAVCQNITVFLDGSGNATIVAADIDAGSSDNCGSVTLSASQTAFTCADQGPNNVTLTADDGNGNTSDCVAIVTVSDTVSPAAVCQNITVFLDGAGNATIVAADIDGGSLDNCGSVTLSASQVAFTCADQGPNNVTLTADDGNGNTSDCVAIVTVSDTVSPAAVCQNITVFLDGAGNATIVAADIDGGSLDNCGSVTLSASQVAFTCANVGVNNVTLTADDGNGNTSDCTAVVTVSDTISPIAVCQNFTVMLDGMGNATIVATDIDGGSSDNCGAPMLSASQTAFTAADLGMNNVTLTVDDGNGNTSDCVAVVTVVCAGINATVHIVTDNFGSQTTWEIFDAVSGSVAAGGPYADNTDITEAICLPTTFGQCYSFFVFDSFGDGLCCGNGMGEWALLDQFGNLILRDNGEFTSQSPAAVPQSPGYVNGHEFCLPLGPSTIAANDCNVFTNELKDRVFATFVPGVSQYQFEFSDPDNGFRRSLAVGQRFVTFSGTLTNNLIAPLVPGTTYFCRVRVDQGATGFADDHYGAGCEMGIDDASVPGCTQLIDNLSLPTHSCGVSRSLDVGDHIWADPVLGTDEYQFRFENAAEGYLRFVRIPDYVLTLNTYAVLPLEEGFTYDVTVQLFIAGTPGGFCGSVCQLTIVPPPAFTSGGRITESLTTANLYPNPVRDGQVQFALTDLPDEEQNISVAIYDLFGKLVVTKEFGNTGSAFNTIIALDEGIASGTYLVQIAINNEVIVERLSVQ